jgi:predicted outer membrane repeat protein
LVTDLLHATTNVKQNLCEADTAVMTVKPEHLSPSGARAPSAPSLRPFPRSRRVLAPLAIALVGALTSAATAGAATFTVNDTRDLGLEHSNLTQCRSSEGTCTLRAAVQAADNVGGASTIILPADEYELTLESTAEDQPANGDLDIRGSATAITIEGAGAGETVINANHIDRAFAVQSGESLAVSGLTVENGNQASGSPGTDSSVNGYGGAFLNLGTLTITGCVLTGNEGGDGGGVINAEGTGATSILDSTVEGNSSESEGGVLSIYGGSVTLTGDTISHNKSGGAGGAIYVNEEEPAPIEVSKTTVSGNESAAAGGAIYATTGGEHGESSLIVSESTLNEDVALGHPGGAIFEYRYGAVEVEDSTLSSDSAGEGEEGGAIWAAGGSRLTVTGSAFDGDGATIGGAIYASLPETSLTGSTFHGDHAHFGGALFLAGTETTVTGSTFSEDEAIVSGGAIQLGPGRLNVFASTFSGNSAPDGGAIKELGEHGMQLVNDTFAGNEASTGGALSLNHDEEQPQAESLLLNDTIVRNSATEGGGLFIGRGVYAYVRIENTIVALNTGGDCQSSGSEDAVGEADKGGNMDSDRTCFSNLVTGDHSGVNPLLAPLGSYGGPTETVALLSGSPAIAGGVNSPEPCPATDQRGVERTGACDAGAYEGVYVPPAQGSGSGSTTTTTTTTRTPVLQQPCRSGRSETIHWKVSSGVALSRIRVTVDGRTYRTLPASARSLTVSLVGRAKGPVTVRITGLARSGARYRMTRVFHTCVPARAGGRATGNYLRRA